MKDETGSRREALGLVTAFAAAAALLAVAAIGCDESGADPQADAGDTDTATDDAGAAGPSTCLGCHTDEEALLASLEADPLPEEEEDEEESTGEG